MPEYPPDLKLEVNIPVWIDFDWNPQYKKQPFEGKTKSGNAPGSPYWRYPVVHDGIKKQWTLWSGQAPVKDGVEAIRRQGIERIAVLKIEEDKKHIYCISDPKGFLMGCIPSHEIPQRFKDFVGVNGSALPPQRGGVVSPQVAAPPLSLPCKTMEECVREAYEAWYSTLVMASTRRFEVDDSVKTDAEVAFIALQQAMANGLAQTAHTLFMNSNGR